MPRNTFLNWTIPALTNSNVGSSAGTSDELGPNDVLLAREVVEESAANL